MTSDSVGHMILTPTQPVGSGRPQRRSHPGPPHPESRALPTELSCNENRETGMVDGECYKGERGGSLDAQCYTSKSKEGSRCAEVHSSLPHWCF